jgi:hypothetical protein
MAFHIFTILLFTLINHFNVFSSGNPVVEQALSNPTTAPNQTTSATPNSAQSPNNQAMGGNANIQNNMINNPNNPTQQNSIGSNPAQQTNQSTNQVATPLSFDPSSNKNPIFMANPNQGTNFNNSLPTIISDSCEIINLKSGSVELRCPKIIFNNSQILSLTINPVISSSIMAVEITLQGNVSIGTISTPNNTPVYLIKTTDTGGVCLPMNLAPNIQVISVPVGGIKETKKKKYLKKKK